MLTPLLLAAMGLALFFAPHRGSNAPAAKRTLHGMTRDLMHFSADRERHPIALLLFGGSACFSVFLPAVLLTLVRVFPPGATRFLLGVGAVLILLAAAASFLLLALSRSTFGFGPGQIKDATIVATLIPLFSVVTAVIAAIGVFSGDWAQWLRSV